MPLAHDGQEALPPEGLRTSGLSPSIRYPVQSLRTSALKVSWATVAEELDGSSGLALVEYPTSPCENNGLNHTYSAYVSENVPHDSAERPLDASTGASPLLRLPGAAAAKPPSLAWKEGIAFEPTDNRSPSGRRASLASSAGGSRRASLASSVGHVSSVGSHGHGEDSSPTSWRTRQSFFETSDTLFRGVTPVGFSQSPMTLRRLILFVTVHMATYFVELYALVEFARRKLWFFFSLQLTFFLFAGMFYAHAAWTCKLPTQTSGSSLMPLKEQASRAFGMLMLIPYGWGQFVIVVLCLEEYYIQYEKRHRDRREDITGEKLVFDLEYDYEMPVNKFHCKAVNGMFEGFPLASFLLVLIWGIHFPSRDPLFDSHYLHEDTLLSCFFYVALLSSGLGLVELDFCVSSRVAERMMRSIGYELLHWLFRTVEVMMRIFVISIFLLLSAKHMTQRKDDWGLGSAHLYGLLLYSPLVCCFMLHMALITIYGGAETTPVIRILCGIPSFFANVFLFIDSPYKQRAARKLAISLVVRNLVEPLVLIFIAHARIKTHPRTDCHDWWCIWNDCAELLRVEPRMGALSIVMFVLYWPLLFLVISDRLHDDGRKDIYTACENGDVAAVTALTVEATLCLDVNCCDVFGKTPLMLAVTQGHREIVDILLSEGARVDVRVVNLGGPRQRRCFLRSIGYRRRWTALHWAAQKGNPHVVRSLALGAAKLEREDAAAEAAPVVSAVAQANALAATASAFVDTMGDTPLHVAAKRGHVAAVHMLVELRPLWLKVRNKRGLVPAKLTKDVDTLDVLAGKPLPPRFRWGVEEVEMSQTLSRASWARSSTSDHHLGSLPQPEMFRIATDKNEDEEESKDWPQVQLSVARSFGGDAREAPQLEAPGLCSYLACSTGGVLGRMFLVDEMKRQELEAIDELEELVIPDATNSDNIRSYSDPQSGTSSLTLGGRKRSSTSQTSDLENVRAASAEHPSISSIADIDPVDKDGKQIDWWCEIITSRLQAGKPISGNLFSDVPEEAIIGVGGYGRVWRGRCRRAGSWVAVKNMAGKRQNVALAATRECEIANFIRWKPHPCLIALLHVHHFADANLFCLVMEFCPGGDLKDRIKAARRKSAGAGGRPGVYEPAKQAHHWIGQVFLGLEHLHQKANCLLRDLKPDNAVLSSRLHAKLTDFGFSRQGTTSTGAWSFGVPPGTPGYVAPEIIRGDGYDASADMYSFGVVVWVLLSGGIMTRLDPQPPTSQTTKQGEKADYRPLYDDYKLLEKCLVKPARNSAQPLSEHAKSLVLELIARSPRARPPHNIIRRHPFMEALQLPKFGARRDVVNAWLDTMPA